MIVTLDRMQSGQKGIVLNINNKDLIKQRLLDLGLTLNSEVEFKRVAPFGDPIKINIRGSSLAIRKKDAVEISVNVGEN